MLTHQQLSKLADRAAQALKERKCDQIVGRVCIDNSRYSSPQKGPGWMWDDDPADYNMPVTALMVDFNVMTVRLSQQANGLQAAELVPAANVPMRYFGAQGLSRPFQGDTPPRITRRPFTDSIEVHVGRLQQPIEARLTPHDPAAWIASMLVRMLKDRDITWGPIDCRNGPQPKATETLAQHKGATLEAAVRHLNQASENAVGEVLLHEIAISRGIQQPTWPDGARAITDWLTKTVGLDAESFHLVDGSGLSRYNLISADSSIRLLKFMQSHSRFDVFWDSLPTYSVNMNQALGPNQDREIGVAERVHAKGGHMTGVATISGYVDTLHGRRLAFSLLTNGVLGSSEPMHDLRDAVWQRLVRYRPE